MYCFRLKFLFLNVLYFKCRATNMSQLQFPELVPMADLCTMLSDAGLHAVDFSITALYKHYKSSNRRYWQYLSPDMANSKKKISHDCIQEGCSKVISLNKFNHFGNWFNQVYMILWQCRFVWLSLAQNMQMRILSFVRVIDAASSLNGLNPHWI